MFKICIYIYNKIVKIINTNKAIAILKFLFFF